MGSGCEVYWCEVGGSPHRAGTRDREVESLKWYIENVWQRRAGNKCDLIHHFGRKSYFE
jgi:hypothetical protein